MRRYSERNANATLSEINITPLLDLAFVLLIIFMITTPLLDNRVDLVVPTSGAARTQVDPAKVRTISIDRDKNLALEREPLALADLTARMTALREAGDAEAVVVRSHRELPVQDLVDVMDALQRAGITRVGVVTRQEGR